MGIFSSLRNIVLFLLSILILIGIGYKYFEWQTLKSISSIQVSVDKEELGLAEEESKLGNKAYDSFGKLLEPEASTEAQLKQFDELNGLVNQSLNNQENYIKTLENNRKKYDELRTRSNFLFGKKGKFTKQIISSQKEYYDTEIEIANEDLVSSTLLKNLLMVWKDRVVMDEYDLAATKDIETVYSRNFSDIATLEKYTRSDFKFQESDKIKELYPYGYDSLNKFKDYMASYYSVIKDYIGGDLESAGYKYSRLQETEINLNIDFDKLFDEGNERRKERGKKIISSTTEKVRLIKEFKENNLGSYPLLAPIGYWKEDLILCGVYEYKIGYYNLITNKYPDANNFDNLLVQLSEVSPKTDSVDNKFDKSIVKYSNSDKEIKFECTDKEDGKSFSFTTEK